MRAGHHHETWNRLPVAVLAVLVALLGIGGIIRLVQSAAELGPQVGDILTFEPGQRLAYDPPPQVTAARAGLPDCTLDVAVLQRLGGSLVIEARTPLPDRLFHLRWAGSHTSNGLADCGHAAELVLDQEKLSVLALAAGGYGVSHTWRAMDMPASDAGSASER